MTESFDDWLLDEAWMCKDCGVHTGIIGHYYMIHNELWDSLNVQGMLCIGCVENRLGRRLNKDDFTDCPLNHGTVTYMAEELRERIGLNT